MRFQYIIKIKNNVKIKKILLKLKNMKGEEKFLNFV